LKITLISNRSPIKKPVLSIIVLLLGSVFCFYAPAGAQTVKQKEGISMDNPFGVLEFFNWNDSWNSFKYPSSADVERAAALIREAGATWVRMDFIWADIEPSAGAFQFDKYDPIVEILLKRGIKILGVLNYNSASNVLAGRWNYAPDDFKAFAKYAAALAGHYKGKVSYWEVWNEPDSPTYWQPQDHLKGYCELLKEAYPALKSANPDCKVLNGGISNGMLSIGYLYENGAQGYFDIMNIHYFTSPLYDNAIQSVIAYPKLVYKAMVKNGDAGKKIWVTEIGSPGMTDPKSSPNWWAGENPDEARQAEWVREVYSGLLGNENVEKVFWAFFRDCKNHFYNGTDYFGLLRWDFSKKPSFKAFQQAAREWEKGRGK